MGSTEKIGWHHLCRTRFHCLFDSFSRKIFCFVPSKIIIGNWHSVIFKVLMNSDTNDHRTNFFSFDRKNLLPRWLLYNVAVRRKNFTYKPPTESGFEVRNAKFRTEGKTNYEYLRLWLYICSKVTFRLSYFSLRLPTH
jgi:hypothetical protein